MMTLGLLPPYTREDIQAAYREKAKTTHPDHGGSVTDFEELHEAYERAQQERPRSAVPLGTVVPTGLYSPEASPHAMVTGAVTATEERVNETTGLPFRWVVVATDGGEIELVMPPCELVAGNVVQALCWMVGRVVDGLGPEPRGLTALRHR